MSEHNEKKLHFKLVSDKNRKEIEGLTVFSQQAGFIESVSECLQEADELELWRPVGIYNNDLLIGFAMYGYFPEPVPGQLWLDCQRQSEIVRKRRRNFVIFWRGGNKLKRFLAQKVCLQSAVSGA